jgi:hypothetical protein
LETPILKSLFASLEPEHVARLEAGLEVPSLDLSEAPLEMELFVPFETLTLEPLFALPEL